MSQCIYGPFRESGRGGSGISAHPLSFSGTKASFPQRWLAHPCCIYSPAGEFSHATDAHKQQSFSARPNDYRRSDRSLSGVASAWLIYPVRSIMVLRRRIADALLALSDAFDPATTSTPDSFVASMVSVEQVAPAFKASRLITRPFKPVHPADWIDALVACREPAIALIHQQAAPVHVRRAIGAARKAMREPETLLPALSALRDALKPDQHPPQST